MGPLKRYMLKIVKMLTIAEVNVSTAGVFGVVLCVCPTQGAEEELSSSREVCSRPP